MEQIKFPFLIKLIKLHIDYYIIMVTYNVTYTSIGLLVHPKASQKVMRKKLEENNKIIGEIWFP